MITHMTEELGRRPDKTTGRKRDDQRTEAILIAAADLLLEVGFDRIRTQDIAERAGAGKGAIYRRWPTKEALLAEAIREIAGLYADGILPRPEGYAYDFPDLLTFHDAPTVIEQRLFEMHLKHRMRAFQGVFHANPDYALWYGWSEMVRDLSEIREMSAHMREAAARGAE